jgi:hypothetical protein
VLRNFIYTQTCTRTCGSVTFPDIFITSSGSARHSRFPYRRTHVHNFQGLSNILTRSLCLNQNFLHVSALFMYMTASHFQVLLCVSTMETLLLPAKSLWPSTSTFLASVTTVELLETLSSIFQGKCSLENKYSDALTCLPWKNWRYSYVDWISCTVT